MIYRFILFLLFMTFGQAAAREPKILVLVIASDDLPVYRELQNIWKAYMHLDPEHIEAYFLKADPHQTAPYEIRDDVIWSQTDENLIPGVLNKTLLSIECLLPSIEEYDYVLRTNLSSFYVFPRLLNYVKSLPQSNCYAAFQGNYEGFPFGGGAGVLLSADLARMLIERKQELWNHWYQDDVAIGFFFFKEGVPLIQAPRMDFLSLGDWMAYGHRISSDTFHFRVKNYHPELRLKDDLFIHRQLLKMFYPAL